MGILDRFIKKKTDSTFPENELEKCLMKAATNNSARKDFYMKLLWSDLIVLTADDTSEIKGVKMLEKDSIVKFVNLENGQLPVFTSTNRIFDKGIVKEQVPYMAMQGQNLFSLTKGTTLILNPFSDYGKELLPQEIESLLNGSIFEQNNDIIIEKDTQVQVGQPIKYPDKVIKALTELFRNRPKVIAAYLAAIRMHKNEKNPHLIIGIDYDGHLKEISNEAGPIAELHSEKGEIIDFIQIDNKNGISDYFINETKPFYQRQ
jgi:hypothetical protein